jgi:hypothetical protein
MIITLPRPFTPAMAEANHSKAPTLSEGGNTLLSPTNLPCTPCPEPPKDQAFPGTGRRKVQRTVEASGSPLIEAQFLISSLISVAPRSRAVVRAYGSFVGWLRDGFRVALEEMASTRKGTNPPSMRRPHSPDLASNPPR